MKTKIKRDSIFVYIFRKDFWLTIKPFLSQKSTKKSDEPILLKDSDDNLIPDQEMVVEKLNTLYISIADNIGINATKQNDETHPSIQKINRLPAKNDPAPPAPPPLQGNFADIVYLKEQSFLHRIRDVCTL